MSSSTSSSSSSPSLTVVIGSNAPGALESCLAALEPQLVDGVEVRVHEGVGSPPALRERFPWATFVTSPGALVPELWRDGAAASQADAVAFTIAPMVPAPDWVASIRTALREHEAVGGAIDPAPGLRATDWAEYFCRYARDMRPFAAGANLDLPGDNAAFSRRRLLQVAEALRDGYWEPVTHPALERRGVVLWHTPEVVVRMGPSAGFAAFCRQRLAHGRRYGHQRGVRFSRARNLLGVGAAPLVPALMTLRVAREVFARGRFRGRLVAALPVVVAYNAVWAWAEALGHLDVVRGRARDA